MAKSKAKPSNPNLDGSGTLEELLGVSADKARELEATIAAQVEQSERDIAAMKSDLRVSFRWGAPQLAVVKRAADLLGVPYQTYLKQAVMERALEDITRYQKAMGRGA